jgi:hypothetical protein
LACIIPVVGSTQGLETTLASVLERRPDTCEVLVVLNVPYQDPFDLQGEIRFLQAPANANLVDCLNIGISATSAPIVHLLASGSEVEHGWIEYALSHFEDSRVAAVTPLVFDRANHERLLAAGVSCSRGGQRFVHCVMLDANGLNAPLVGPLMHAAFYRKAALETLGGGLPIEVSEDLADIDLLLSLRQAGWQSVVEPNCRVFAASINSLKSNGFACGLSAERFYWRHFTEAGGVGGLFSHAWSVVTDLLRSKPLWTAPAQALGRLVALCQFGHYRKQRQLISAARNVAAATQTQWEASQEVARNDATAPADRQHRVDSPHKDIGAKNSKHTRQAYRRNKRRSSRP